MCVCVAMASATTGGDGETLENFNVTAHPNVTLGPSTAAIVETLDNLSEKMKTNDAVVNVLIRQICTLQERVGYLEKQLIAARKAYVRLKVDVIELENARTRSRSRSR